MEELAMEKTIKVKLSEPIHTLGGQELAELTLDFSQIRARDLAAINRLESRLKGTDAFSLENVSKASSTEWRLAFAWIAACRGTQGLCYDDIENLTIPDCMELSTISLPFAVKI